MMIKPKGRRKDEAQAPQLKHREQTRNKIERMLEDIQLKKELEL